MFLTSTGKSALSSFRLEKLRVAVKAVAPGVALEATRHWYFTSLSSALSDTDNRLLERMLGLGEVAKLSSSLSHLLVVPRLGTISPWSSKATDIAQHCALPAVKRIEHGVMYYFKSKKGHGLSRSELKKILPLLHDRMTESIISDVDGIAEKIFAHGEAHPGRRKHGIVGRELRVGSGIVQ
jgi:phosphoribosylformylglycinamidine synthase